MTNPLKATLALLLVGVGCSKPDVVTPPAPKPKTYRLCLGALRSPKP